MPDQKKKCHSPICMSPSRRMVIKSMEIKDMPQRMICVSSSLSTPTQSTSHLCSCNQDYCIPDACGKPLPPAQDSGGPPGQQTACPRTCKMFDGVMVDNTTCCQEMLRKLAQESLAFNQVDRRVSNQEPHDPSTYIVPCCVENNPVPSTAICITKSYPQVKPIEPKPCPGCQETQRLEQKEEKQVEDCSVESCARNPISNTKIQCSEECESKDKVPELQSSICKNQQLRNKPLPIPPRNVPCPKAVKSNEKLNAKPIKKDKKKTNKTDKKDDKKIKNGKNVIEQSCNHEKCIVNNPCPCRFPPAYSQYYNCTGQISGNCTCGQNNIEPSCK